MNTTITEIGDGIIRLATAFPEVGTTFNQFLIDAEEPLLFHCGMRSLFPSVCEAVETVMPLHRLRWLSFGHVEADEMGAMNLWLAVAPRAQVVHSPLGCALSVNDLADRAPVQLADGETLELGGRRVRMIETPHIPHNWESIMLFEEVTATLLCGDLGANGHLRLALTDDLVADAIAFHRDMPGAASLSPTTPRLTHRLADLSPRHLAVMHGASFTGDGATELHRLATQYQQLIETELINEEHGDAKANA